MGSSETTLTETKAGLLAISVAISLTKRAQREGRKADAVRFLNSAHTLVDALGANAAERNSDE